MSTDPREDFISAVETLPRDIAGSDAAQLLRIVEELRCSYSAEIGIIDEVERVNSEDPQAVKSLYQDLEARRSGRLFDNERTHCSNIWRIGRALYQKRPVQGKQGAQALGLRAIIGRLGDADRRFIDDIEQIVDEAVSTAFQMDQARRLTDVEAIQRQFSASMRRRKEELRATLKRMNDLSNQLIDLI